MAFLVRKLIKMSELFSLCERTEIKEIYADIPTTEFRTKNGTLSTWHINSLDDIEDAILAIAFTSSDITKMDFIIIDTDILSKNSLEYKKTYAGQEIAIVDLQDTHYDIVNITIEKLITVQGYIKQLSKRILMLKHTSFVILPEILENY
ncbi:MAG TPA: hypothetical protein P5535_00760 [Clostridia bacterium]|nr:hypothetical protein [Clostridia bacterium]